MAQIFTMSSAALPPNAHVVGFVGREALSEPYAFHIGLEINDEGFDADAALRAAASLEIHASGGSEPHAVHGIVAAVELLHTYAGKALYRLTLVPKLWHLGRSVHSRVFTDNTIIETIEAVLRHGGLATGDFRFQLLHDYAKLEHVCQYKESDLAFLSRWMEREGLYYFFDHTGEREELVITDSLSFHGSRQSGTVRYVPLSGSDHMALEALDVFMAKHSALPSRVRLTDYDYLRPKLELGGGHDIDARGVGVVQLFGEHLRDTAEGDRYAKVRAQEQLAEQKVFHGRGRVFRLRPNYCFTLDEHPIGAYNGKSYLVTALEHVGNQSATEAHIRELLGLAPDANDEYLVHVTAIGADVQYRAPRRVSWPRVDGYELAVVCGEAASDYAQLDEHGRYKCRVMFDESDLVDGSATTWVRMMQPHGGGVEGFHFPLRKGTEILLFFLAGDPDRPVIAGVAPNPLKPSPVTSGNHTQNVVQTGGHNRIEMEDQAGGQYITQSTPYANSSLHLGAPQDGYEVVLRTDDNKLVSAGKNFTLDVGHTGGGSWEALIQADWRTHVETGVHELWVDAGSSSTTVKGDTSLHVTAGNLTTNVDAGTMSTTVQGDTSLRVLSGDLSTEVDAGAMRTLVKAGLKSTEVQGDFTERVNAGNYELDVVAGTALLHSQGKLTLDTADACAVQVGSNMNLTVGGNETREIHGTKEENVFGPHFEHAFADNIKVSAGFSMSASLAASIDLSASASLSIKTGVELSINAALSHEVKVFKKKESATKIENCIIVLNNSALHLSGSNVHVFL